ncbi:MAG TPA: hypothetical protein VN689_14260 [Burkholderiales bacterium]|nr:hypothetical protein [Burkholderiales bacterium]
MLVELHTGALALLPLLRTLGFAAAESRAVGVGLLRRRFFLSAFSEAFQIDDITHARLHHAKTAGKERQRRVKIDPITIQNPRMPVSDNTNN